MAEFQGKKIFTPRDAAVFFGMDLLKFDDVSRWLISRLHPDGVKCPSCSIEITNNKRLERYRQMEQIRCIKCGKKFTAKTGTILNETKLEAREIYLLAVLIDLQVPISRIASILRVHVDTVRNWQTKFQALAEVAGA